MSLKNETQRMNTGKCKLALTLLLLIFFNLFINGQSKVTQDNYARFRHLTIEDGLPGNKINSLFQDKDLYIWIGTNRGLSRYDGHNFKNFVYIENDTTSLPDNFVVCIKQDSIGNIWAATKNGLAFYNKNKEQFTRIPLISETGKGLSSDRIRCILPDRYPFIWVETEDGNLHYLNSETFESKIYPHTRITQSYYNYHSIFKDSYDKVWIGGRNLGTVFFDPETKALSQIPADSKDQKKKRDNDVACYFEDSRNRFWISGTDGFYLYDRINDIFTKKLAISTFQIAEDNNRKLWLATGGGLYRYSPENNSFVKFVHNESDPFSISANHQYCILTDVEGNIWTGTNAGINILLKDQTFIKHYRHIPSLKHSLNNNKVTSFFELSDSVIYVGTSGGGLNVLNTNDENFKAFTTQNPGKCPISADQVSVIKGDPETLWIGLWRGVGFNRFNVKNRCFTRYTVSPNTFKVDWYNDFYDDGSDTLWCGIWGGNGIHFFDKKRGEFLTKNFQPRYHPDNSPLYKQFITGDLLITINAHGIIYIFDNHTHTFNGYVSNVYKKFAAIYKLRTADIPRGIKKINDGINTGSSIILATNKGLIYFNRTDTSFHHISRVDHSCYAVAGSSEHHSFWVATERGLEYYDHDKKESFLIEKNNDKTSPLFNKKITSLYLNKRDQLLIGTNSGLLLYNPLISGFVSIPEAGKSELANTPVKAIGVLPGNKLYFILKQGFALTSGKLDSVHVFNVSNSFRMRMPTDIIFDIEPGINDNTILLATDIGIIKYYADSAHFSKIKKLDDHTVYSLKSLNGKLSVCTDKGYLQYDPSTDSLIHFNYPPSDRLSSHLISFLHKDNNGYVWAGTTDRGVNRIDPGTGFIHHYFEGNDRGFTGEDALCFLQTVSGKIYIGGKKINLYDPKSDKFIKPGFADMLPDEPVTALLEDNDNNLWIITENNIFRYSHRNKTITNIKKLLGFKDLSFTGGALKQLSGDFLIGTKQGFLQFNPQNIRLVVTNTPVQVTEISVFGKDISPEKKIKNGVVLNYDENFFRINYSAMNYSSVETTYEYMLEGIDKEWVRTDKPTTAYTKIAPGKYQFKVRNSALPDKTLTTFRIIIKPPFWKTWWFILAVVLILASLAVFWWKQRLTKVRTIENNLKLKQRLLLSQLNPHFIFNALTAIQSYVYQNDPQKTGHYLSKFAKLMRLVLENMRSENTPIDKEIDTLTYYLEMQRLRFNESFEFKITTSGIPDKSKTYIPSMMLQPVIENAVEHGLRNIKEDGKILVDLTLAGNKIKVTIEDNGLGYDPEQKRATDPVKAKKHRSLSTKIIKERIDGFNKKMKEKAFTLEYTNLTDEETGTTGTRVTLILPVKETTPEKNR